jgi:hypothetical protein
MIGHKLKVVKKKLPLSKRRAFKYKSKNSYHDYTSNRYYRIRSDGTRWVLGIDSIFFRRLPLGWYKLASPLSESQVIPTN